MTDNIWRCYTNLPAMYEQPARMCMAEDGHRTLKDWVQGLMEREFARHQLTLDAHGKVRRLKA